MAKVARVMVVFPGKGSIGGKFTLDPSVEGANRLLWKEEFGLKGIRSPRA
jgi:hypothetical protein